MTAYGILSGEILAGGSLGACGIIIALLILGIRIPHAPVVLIALALLTVLGGALLIINAASRQDDPA